MHPVRSLLASSQLRTSYLQNYGPYHTDRDCESVRVILELLEITILFVENIFSVRTPCLDKQRAWCSTATVVDQTRSLEDLPPAKRVSKKLLDRITSRAELLTLSTKYLERLEIKKLVRVLRKKKMRGVTLEEDEYRKMIEYLLDRNKVEPLAAFAQAADDHQLVTMGISMRWIGDILLQQGVRKMIDWVQKVKHYAKLKDTLLLSFWLHVKSKMGEVERKNLNEALYSAFVAVVTNKIRWIFSKGGINEETKNENIERAKWIQDELVKYMLDCELEISVPFYNKLVKWHGMEGQVELMIHTFAHMKSFGVEPNKRTYHLMIQGFGRGDYFDSIAKIFQGMTANVSPDANTYMAIIVCFARGNLLSPLLQMYESATISSRDPRVFAFLIEYFAAKKDLKNMLLVYTDARKAKIGVTVRAYNSLIHCLGSFGETESMMEVFRDLMAKKKKVKEKTFVSIVQGFCVAGNTEAMMKVYEQMLRTQWKPSKSLYHLMIRTAIQQNDMESLRTLIDHVHSNRMSMVSLLHIGNSGDEVKTLFDEISKKGVTNRLLATLSHIGVTRGDVPLIMDAFAQRNKRFPSLHLPERLLSSSLKQSLALASQVFQELKKVCPLSALYQSYVLLLVQNRQVNAFLSTYEEMKTLQLSPDAQWYQQLMLSLASSVTVETVITFYNHLKELKIPFTHGMYHRILSALGNDLDKITAMFYDVQEDPRLCHALHGLFLQAFDSPAHVDKLLKLTESILRHTVTPVTYKVLARACKYCEVEAVAKLFVATQEATKFPVVTHYSMLITELAKVGCMDKIAFVLQDFKHRFHDQKESLVRILMELTNTVVEQKQLVALRGLLDILQIYGVHDVYCYSKVTAAATTMGDVELLHDIYRHIRSNAACSDQFYVNWRFAITQMAPDAALKVIDALLSRNEIHFQRNRLLDMAIRIATKTKDVERANQYYQMRKEEAFPNDAVPHFLMMAAATDQGHFKKAMRAHKKFVALGHTNDEYTAKLFKLAKKSHNRTALVAIYNHMMECNQKLTLPAYMMLINNARVDATLALRVLKSMKDNGIVPTRRIYKCLLRLARTNVDATQQIHEDMTQNVTLNLPMYHRVLRLYAVLMREDLVIKTLEQMKRHIEPTEVSYGYLLVCHARSGNLEKLMATFQLMKNNLVSMPAMFREVLRCYAKYKHLAMLQYLLSSMESVGYRITWRERYFLAFCYQRLQLPNKVLEEIESMEKPDLSVQGAERLYALLASTHASLGNTAQVTEILQSARECKRRHVIHYHAMNGYARADNAGGIHNVIQEMMDTGYETLLVYNIALRVCASHRNTATLAQEIYRTMEAKNIKPDRSTYTWLLRAMAEDTVKGAEKIFAKIQKTFGADRWAYSNLMTVYAKNNKTKRLIETFNEMNAQNLHPDGLAWTQILRCIARTDANTLPQFYLHAKQANVSKHHFPYRTLLRVAESSHSSAFFESVKKDIEIVKTGAGTIQQLD